MIPSPIAVPGFVSRESRAKPSATRSTVGRLRMRARRAKDTTPTWNFEGRSSRNDLAAFLAASMRVGGTSTASIERDESIASTTVARSRGTLIARCGRATARINTARPNRYRARGT
jgi:hypothetical protein